MTTTNLSDLNRPPVVLASASPRRIDLLRQTGLDFTVDPPQVEELHSQWLKPAELVRCNARLKADRVSARHPGALVIGADTMVVLGERIFGKPSTLDEAQSMLFALAGNTHEVFTGVCLRQTEPGWPEGLLEEFVTSAQVTFRPLHPDAITRYLQRVDPFDKAGGYALQEDEGELIAQVEGDPEAVIGLPRQPLQDAITRLFPQLWPSTPPAS